MTQKQKREQAAKHTASLNQAIKDAEKWGKMAAERYAREKAAHLKAEKKAAVKAKEMKVAAKQEALHRCACENPGNGGFANCTQSRTCACDGEARLGFGTKWTKWKPVAGTIECSNEAFNEDPFFGQAKECQCRKACPAAIQVGGVDKEQGKRAGAYHKTGFDHAGYPVYMQKGGKDYLYVVFAKPNDKRWVIGPDFTNGHVIYILSKQTSAVCPTSIKKWWYWSAKAKGWKASSTTLKAV